MDVDYFVSADQWSSPNLKDKSRNQIQEIIIANVRDSPSIIISYLEYLTLSGVGGIEDPEFVSKDFANESSLVEFVLQTVCQEITTTSRRLQNAVLLHKIRLQLKNLLFSPKLTERLKKVLLTAILPSEWIEPLKTEATLTELTMEQFSSTFTLQHLFGSLERFGYMYSRNVLFSLVERIDSEGANPEIIEALQHVPALISLQNTPFLRQESYVIALTRFISTVMNCKAHDKDAILFELHVEANLEAQVLNEVKGRCFKALEKLMESQNDDGANMTYQPLATVANALVKPLLQSYHQTAKYLYETNGWPLMRADLKAGFTSSFRFLSRTLVSRNQFSVVLQQEEYTKLFGGLFLCCLATDAHEARLWKESPEEFFQLSIDCTDKQLLEGLKTSTCTVIEALCDNIDSAIAALMMYCCQALALPCHRLGTQTTFVSVIDDYETALSAKREQEKKNPTLGDYQNSFVTLFPDEVIIDTCMMVFSGMAYLTLKRPDLTQMVLQVYTVLQDWLKVENRALRFLHSRFVLMMSLIFDTTLKSPLSDLNLLTLQQMFQCAGHEDLPMRLTAHEALQCLLTDEDIVPKATAHADQIHEWLNQAIEQTSDDTLKKFCDLYPDFVKTYKDYFHQLDEKGTRLIAILVERKNHQMAKVVLWNVLSSLADICQSFQTTLIALLFSSSQYLDPNDQLQLLNELCPKFPALAQQALTNFDMTKVIHEDIAPPFSCEFFVLAPTFMTDPNTIITNIIQILLNQQISSPKPITWHYSALRLCLARWLKSELISSDHISMIADAMGKFPDVEKVRFMEVIVAWSVNRSFVDRLKEFWRYLLAVVKTYGASAPWFVVITTLRARAFVISRLGDPESGFSGGLQTDWDVVKFIEESVKLLAEYGKRVQKGEKSRKSMFDSDDDSDDDDDEDDDDDGTESDEAEEEEEILQSPRRNQDRDLNNPGDDINMDEASQGPNLISLNRLLPNKRFEEDDKNIAQLWIEMEKNVLFQSGESKKAPQDDLVVGGEFNVNSSENAIFRKALWRLKNLDDRLYGRWLCRVEGSYCPKLKSLLSATSVSTKKDAAKGQKLRRIVKVDMEFYGFN
eukprot:CAMPEP_0115041144 /NCGR_PEP_ID=MMETSP0216-20121206/45331_1 /TAXON_ID=223996 /ORGANISM="Protocruzia adherens, Strain Boccale" /LENGTH=1085 /DNA_ID=CAMNT_0002422683 /DNA_START=12 /DNA_END=3269 /DNA_ORIENTATION=-